MRLRHLLLAPVSFIARSVWDLLEHADRDPARSVLCPACALMEPLRAQVADLAQRAEQAEADRDRVRAALDGAQRENSELHHDLRSLRAAVVAAPHDLGCPCRPTVVSGVMHQAPETKCKCWRGKALASITKRTPC